MNNVNHGILRKNEMCIIEKHILKWWHFVFWLQEMYTYYYYFSLENHKTKKIEWPEGQYVCGLLYRFSSGYR